MGLKRGSGRGKFYIFVKNCHSQLHIMRKKVKYVIYIYKVGKISVQKINKYIIKFLLLCFLKSFET